MNKTSKRILTELLQDKAYWKNTKPRLPAVQKGYAATRENLFMNEVWWIRIFRANRLIKAFGILPEDHFGWLRLDDNLEGWVIQCNTTRCNCDYKISYIEQRMSLYFNRIWYDDDWQYETFTLEDLLSIQPTPPGDYQLPLI